MVSVVVAVALVVLVVVVVVVVVVTVLNTDPVREILVLDEAGLSTASSPNLWPTCRYIGDFFS